MTGFRQRESHRQPGLVRRVLEDLALRRDAGQDLEPLLTTTTSAVRSDS